ncbi:phage GP46 family protein, partial [Serratia marcescens]|uniref:phage GP46 family protein n=4 Tax=Serratia TaxID=613 RepID=UPI001BD4CDDF
MSDISSFWDIERLVAEWREGNGDLINGDDLQTAMIISLFTDRVARDDDDIDGEDRRGWWGDMGEDHNIGSRLWLLRRQKLTQD